MGTIVQHRVEGVPVVVAARCVASAISPATTIFLLAFLRSPSILPRSW
jgi:hypothetical protein